MSVHDVRPLRRTLEGHPRRDEVIEYLDEGQYRKAKKATANPDQFAAVAMWMFDFSVATPYEHQEQVYVLERAAKRYDEEMFLEAFEQHADHQSDAAAA